MEVQTSVVGGAGEDVGSGQMTSVAAGMVGKMTSRVASPLLPEAPTSHTLSRVCSLGPTYYTLLPSAAHATQPHSVSAVDQPIIDQTVPPRPLPAMVDAADHTIVDQTIETGPQPTLRSELNCPAPSPGSRYLYTVSPGGSLLDGVMCIMCTHSAPLLTPLTPSP